MNPLSPRQREIMRLMSRGDADKEIADKLAISTGTVRFHIRRILAKTRARSRVHALWILTFKAT
jgi:DNA-binding CsgD family transcriptional regulator